MRVADASRYTLIRGRFWIHYPDLPHQGPEPDGDTVRFEPDNRSFAWSLDRFSGVPPDFNRRGNIAVRFEGIDALETHFKGSHQELTRAKAAREENLRLLGFRDVQFSATNPNKVASVAGHPAVGFLLANGIEANGRMLGLVFAGEPSAPDGSKVFVDEALLTRSVNAQLVTGGFAYVEVYDTMPISLVRHLRGIVGAARQAGRGLFGAESLGVGQGAAIPDLEALEGLVMWPKLYRRLVSYFAEGHVGLAGLDSWIREDPVHRDDSLRLPPDGEKGNVHDVYRSDGAGLSLRHHPEDLLIAPDPSA